MALPGWRGCTGASCERWPMPERVRAGDLLRRARALYDSPSCDLAEAACGAWGGGFASGGRWMARALGRLRGGAPPDVPRGMNALGLVKYGLAGAAALACVGLACLMGCWPLLVLSIPAFYTVEAQMVFLFPLALDGSERLFREARRRTARAGGTLVVMGVVLP